MGKYLAATDLEFAKKAFAFISRIKEARDKVNDLQSMAFKLISAMRNSKDILKKDSPAIARDLDGEYLEKVANITMALNKAKEIKKLLDEPTFSMLEILADIFKRYDYRKDRL